MPESANNPLAETAEQVPAGLDDLLASASVLSGEDEHPVSPGALLPLRREESD